MRKTGIYLSSLLLGKQMARSCVLDRLRFRFFFALTVPNSFFIVGGLKLLGLNIGRKGEG